VGALTLELAQCTRTKAAGRREIYRGHESVVDDLKYEASGTRRPAGLPSRSLLAVHTGRAAQDAWGKTHSDLDACDRGTILALLRHRNNLMVCLVQIFLNRFTVQQLKSKSKEKLRCSDF
jgi:hypothetical protein